MNIIDLFVSELDRETERSRRALREMPDDTRAYKPHERSMELGYLADMVATIPTWFTMIVKQDELDVNPPAGGGQYHQPSTTELVSVLDKSVADAHAALDGTTDDFLLTTNWKLLAGGKVMSEELRHIVLTDTMNHLAHHRGQLTVYLRLNDVKVPSIYGPSADDQRFL